MPSDVDADVCITAGLSLTKPLTIVIDERFGKLVPSLITEFGCRGLIGAWTVAEMLALERTEKLESVRLFSISELAVGVV